MKKTFIHYLALTCGFVPLAQQVLGQTPKKEGTLADKVIKVEKNLKIDITGANRIFERIKVAAPPANHLTFNYSEVTVPVKMPEIIPQVYLPLNPNTENDKLGKYNNIVRAGLGNYGHTFLEGHAGIVTGQTNYHGIYLKHNAFGSGPVRNDYSGQSSNEIKAYSRVMLSKIRLEGALDWQRRGFYYYAYNPKTDFDKEQIFNAWNKIGFNATVANANKSAKVDYVFNTGLSYLFTKLKAKEFIWQGDLKGSYPLTNELSANLSANVLLSQAQDSTTTYRNLVKVIPSFKYKVDKFSINLGLMLVASRERSTQSENFFYPVLSADYKLLNGLTLFGGFEGDVTANTLTGLLQENQWLAKAVTLKPTRKVSEIYAGAKITLDNSLTAELKGSYAQYKDFYVLNNAKADTTRFEVLYSNDDTKVHVTTLSGRVHYNLQDIWKSQLLVEGMMYSNLGNLEKAWHRPTMKATWSNSFILKEKLLVTSDFYFLTGLQAKNYVSNTEIKLPAIYDLNLKFTYFINEQFTAFVSANNLFNKKYERYAYYPTQGVNFLAGLSFSF